MTLPLVHDGHERNRIDVSSDGDRVTTGDLRAENVTILQILRSRDGEAGTVGIVVVPLGGIQIHVSAIGTTPARNVAILVAAHDAAIDLITCRQARGNSGPEPNFRLHATITAGSRNRGPNRRRSCWVRPPGARQERSWIAELCRLVRPVSHASDSLNVSPTIAGNKE